MVTEVEEQLGVDLDALSAGYEQEPSVMAGDVEVPENAQP